MKNIEKINQQATEIIIEKKKTYSTVSLLRIFSFLLSLTEIIRYVLISNVIELGIGILSFFGFILLLNISRNLLDSIEFYKNINDICFEIKEEGRDVLESTLIEIDHNHPYSNDLDIFGNKSLFQRINRCQTNFGKNKLHFFLENHLLSTAEINARQNAVKELSQKLEWNIKFLATAKAIKQNDSSFKTASSWSFSYPNFKLNKKSVRILLIGIPIFNVTWIVTAIVIKSTLFSSLMFLAAIAISLIINLIYGKSVREIYASVNNKSSELKGYSSLFLLIEHETFISNENIFLQKKTTSSNKIATSVLIKKLSDLIDSFDSSTVPIFGGLLDIIFLWKLQFASRIETFITDNYNELPKGFQSIAEFEALICFGLFAYKNQEFVYPVCIEQSETIKAINLSHPLLSRKVRIANNFSINQNNNVTIITGANMTGKSTFLRSIGINMVLAMNGCPVCAESFHFRPISIFTSMRTNDSLSDGSSYFNAEIKRLKLLIDKLEKNEPQFIILDEILKGTNSVDKLKGSEMFLEKIIKIKTLMNCIIATHDLELTKMESKYPNNITNFCFELDNKNGVFEPDYKLQKGVTTSMNAIELMKMNNIID